MPSRGEIRPGGFEVGLFSERTDFGKVTGATVGINIAISCRGCVGVIPKVSQTSSLQASAPRVTRVVNFRVSSIQ